MSFYTPCVDKIRCLLNFMLLCVLDRLPVRYSTHDVDDLGLVSLKYRERLKPLKLDPVQTSLDSDRSRVTTEQLHYWVGSAKAACGRT